MRLLKLQGKSKSTIDAYSRAVRRVNEYLDQVQFVQVKPEPVKSVPINKFNISKTSSIREKRLTLIWYSYLAITPSLPVIINQEDF